MTAHAIIAPMILAMIMIYLMIRAATVVPLERLLKLETSENEPVVLR